MLGYGKAYDLTRALDPDEVQTHNVRSSLQGPGKSGNQLIAIINESGLYHAIFKSRKPEAKKFRRWVTEEVVPSVRRHGFFDQRGDGMVVLSMVLRHHR